jgi:hypothetical protein
MWPPRMCSTGRKMTIPFILLISLGSLELSGCGRTPHGPRRLELPTSGSQSPRESPAANPDESEFLGTVTSIKQTGSPDPRLWWVVTLSVDKVTSGSLPMKTFQIAIHSPSLEHVELGHQYRIAVSRSEAGYRTGEHPFFPLDWRNALGPK